MKLKILLLSVMMLFVLGFIKANPVTKDLAAKVAVNFYYLAINADKPTDISSIKISDNYTIAENGITYYYVFNIKDGGFVIVSAEDAMNPILGYSFEKNYSENNPSPEFAWWMSGYKDQIRYAIENKLTANAKTREQWNEFSNYKPFEKSPLDVTVGPLILSRWDQGSPYNELCPVDSVTPPPNGPCAHVLVGCVAVAMGQLMYYYKYPLQGSGESCYYSSYGLLCSYYRDSVYNWNAMQNQPTTSNIPLASLLSQCGISVQMNYGCNASGAYSSSVPGALINYFNYSPSLALYSRTGYSQQDWENLLQTELNQKRPLYYSGQDFTPPVTGGHAFNCDGYKVVGSTTTYHFNWGWSGSYDGWFDINNLNPGGYEFNSQHQAIINSVPNTGYPYNCSGTNTLTTINGVFEDGSGHLDYQPNLNCSWLINPNNPSGTEKISFKFDLFEVTDPNDVITIYNGENASAPVLATYKGGQAPVIGTSYSSTSNKLFVTFTTNGTTSGGGWHISYSANNFKHCSGTFVLLNSNYAFDDGSGSTYHYNNNTNCRWSIKPDNATWIKVKFNLLDTEASKDLVKVFRGESPSNDSLIGTYSGNTPPADTILIPSGKMLILFTSDGSRTAQGWSVGYKSNGTSIGIDEKEIVNQFSLFPNPAENNVKISFNVNTLQNIQLSLIDVVGNSIYTENISNFIGVYDKTIDLSGFAEGLYVVRIKTDLGTYNKKLVIR